MPIRTHKWVVSSLTCCVLIGIFLVFYLGRPKRQEEVGGVVEGHRVRVSELSPSTLLPLPQKKSILKEKNKDYISAMNSSLQDRQSPLRPHLLTDVRTLYLQSETGMSLLELLNEGDIAIQVRAASILARQGREDGKMILKRALKEKGGLVQLDAAIGLAALGEQEAIDNLKQFLNHPNWNIRLEAVEAIGYTGQPPLGELLYPLLNDTSEYVRVAAAGSLLRLGDASQKGVLYKGLNSPDSAIQYRAAFPLAEAGDPAPLEFFRKEFNEYDLSVKAHVGYYMALLGDLSGIPALNEALIKGDDETRAFALAALTALSTPSK